MSSPAMSVVPFAPPEIGPDEIAEVVATLESGWLSTGPRVHQFERAFAGYVGAPHAVALNSCTAGLHLALLAAGIGPGDEVITSPLTFCATANVVLHAGATALFVHAGGDVGDSHSWRAGLSLLNAKALDQSLATTGALGGSSSTAFSGRTRVAVADAVWKWAPGGNATRTNFKLQGEYYATTFLYDHGKAAPTAIDHREHAVTFQVIDAAQRQHGMLYLPTRWSVRRRTPDGGLSEEVSES